MNLMFVGADEPPDESYRLFPGTSSLSGKNIFRRPKLVDNLKKVFCAVGF